MMSDTSSRNDSGEKIPFQGFASLISGSDEAQLFMSSKSNECEICFD